MRKTISLLLILGPLFILALVKPWLGPHFLSEENFFFIFAVVTGLSVGGGFLWKKNEKLNSVDELKRRFQATFETDNLGFIFSDPKGKVVDANDYFLNLVGYSRKDLEAGQIDWRKITAPEYLSISDETNRLLQEGRPTKPFEKEYIRKNGSRVRVLLSVRRVENSGSQIVSVLDISDRKKAEQKVQQTYAEMEAQIERRVQEIRESRHFLDSVIENIPNMIFVKDAKELRFVRFNRAGEELLGYSREDLLGKNDMDFFPKEEADFFINNDKKVLSSNIVVDVPEEPISTRFGPRLLHTKKIPIFDKDGKAQYLLGISEDITEKKQAETQRYHLLQEQAAREEAERTAQHLSFLADASQALGKSLNYRETLRSFVKIVTRSFADLCSIHLFEEPGGLLKVLALGHSNPKQLATLLRYREEFPVNWINQEAMKGVLRTGECEIYDNFTDFITEHAKVPDAEMKLLMELNFGATIFVPLNLYGKTLGAMSFSYAGHERHYSSFDLSLAQELGKRVSFALENAQLYEKAQEANRAKTSFLANMSHEIRTPLGAMIGFAELIKEAPSLQKDTVQLQSVDTIIRNGRQLLRIVDEILDISKVESERLSIENIRFSLVQLVNEVITLLSFQAKEKGLNFNFKSAENLPEFVVSDPTRMRQILINVIGNAIKFTEKGSVDISLSAQPSSDSPQKTKLIFSVTDSGVGISPNQAKILFQAFTQGDSSMTRKFGGTGLGLFISRKLAQALGGNLVLEKSELGHGSNFVISVEVATADAIEVIEKPKSVATPPIATSRTHELRVLLVEDAPDNRALVGRFINLMGFQCDFAEDGFQGVEKALKGSYDVVLMDIQMPGMDGFEALQKLRANHYHGPVVALTAHAMKGDRERCLESGFDDYLMKPIHRNQLQEVLSHYAQEKRPSLHP